MTILTVPVEIAPPVSVAVMRSTNGVDVYAMLFAVVIAPVAESISKSELGSPPENKDKLNFHPVPTFV